MSKGSSRTPSVLAAKCAESVGGGEPDVGWGRVPPASGAAVQEVLLPARGAPAAAQIVACVAAAEQVNGGTVSFSVMYTEQNVRLCMLLLM